ncbi:hypothetical protein PFISCL1PPCAC_26426, partial [Pristionchus fissidentatus]
MRFDLLYLLIPLSSAQFLPFNILNIPPQVRNPMIQTYMEMTKVNTQCFRDIKQFIGDVINASFAAQKCKSLDCLKDEKITNASYALKQIAATGRPQSLGLEDVSLTWPGDPKLCRSIEGPYETKYCYAHVNVDFGSIDFAEYGIQVSNIPGGKIPNFDMGETSGKCDPLAIGNMRLAMCIPASCEKDQDMGRIISTVTNDSVHLCEMTCTGPTKEPDTFFYLMNAVILSLLVVAVTASILDYIATQNDMELELKNTTGWKILMSFSLLRNTTEIFSVTKGQDSIRSLDALRFITFTWVANGHADLMSADGDNSLAMLKAPDYILSDVFLNAYPAVDTFFVISGLLLAYWFFRKAHGDSKFIKSPMNWVILTPAYLLFIGFYVAWSPQIHDVWAAGSSQNLTLQVQNCEKNWWMNALYMNNFASIVEMCYPISWFLAVDTQLYFVAPIFLVAIYYSCEYSFSSLNRKTGLVAVVSGVLFSVGATILLTAVYDLPAIGFTVLQTGSNDFMSYLYIKPWVRCIPFLTGILTGYFIVQIRKQTIKIRQPKTWELALCWLTSTIVALTIIFSIYNYMRGQSEWNVPLRSFYGSFARIGWSMAIAWVVLACTFDLAGPVKTVLEHPLWYPLGRLSYCAFLSHWFMLQYFMDSADRPTHFVSLLHTYLSITLPVCFLSYLMAYVWSCLVEIPFMKIE